MKKYLLIVFIIITYRSIAQIPADSIRAIIRQEVAAKRSKSIIVGIIDSSGRQIFSEGVLSDDNPVMPDSNTIYEIGSITKVFTSLLLADMSLKHQLNLDDPISKFLPKTMKTPVRDGKEMTLRSLSTHRAGFPRFPYNVDPRNIDDPYADYSVKQLYEYVSAFTPAYAIDSMWRYSNTAYGLLGNILERVTHKDFATLVRVKICTPLRMNNTVIIPTPKLASDMATGHTEYGKPTNFTHLGAIDAAGALRSNVTDLLTYAAANLGFIESNLYPAMELTHVRQAIKDGNKGYVTLGWTLYDDDGKDIVFKDGGTYGFRTFLGIDLKHKFGVVVLSNSNNSVTDIGTHIIDSTSAIKPFIYPWNLLDTVRITIKKKGIAAGIDLYKRLKVSKNPAFVFDENQLNYLGGELRREKRIKDAIAIYELNAGEYPKLPMVYESLGETYKRNNDKKTAIKYFEKARDLEPNNLHWIYILTKLKTTD